MVDPWADIRKLLQERGGIYDITVNEMFDLLRDADVLLAVVRATQNVERRLGTNTREIREALAALPEHLREHHG